MRFFIIVMCVCSCLGKKPQFSQINTYREVQEVFDRCDKNVLITFDIDNTLITGCDAFFSVVDSMPISFVIRALLKHPSLLLRSQSVRVEKTIISQAKFFVFDSDIVRFVRQLQQQGCMVIALTYTTTGSHGKIEDMPKWRVGELKNFGFDFAGQFSDTQFTSLSKYCGNYPVLYKGILCTNRLSKGKVLGAFLDYFHIKPARIVSFDDSKSALDSIERECAQRGVVWTGYQMIGAKNLLRTWNTKRALLQLDYLVQYDRWLSDQEADVLLAEKAQRA